MGTNTSNLNLYKPAVGEQNWGNSVNSNFDIVDGLYDDGLDANKPAAGTQVRMWYAYDTDRVYRAYPQASLIDEAGNDIIVDSDSVVIDAAWELIAAIRHNDLSAIADNDHHVNLRWVAAGNDLQAVIDSLTTGGIIILGPGTFTPLARKKSFVVANPGITIIGCGPSTILTGPGRCAFVNHHDGVIQIKANNVVIKNLQIHHPYRLTGYSGIRLEQMAQPRENIYLEDLYIRSSGGSGHPDVWSTNIWIGAEHLNYVAYENVWIKNCRLDLENSGKFNILISSGKSIWITNNVILNVARMGGAGIWIEKGLGEEARIGDIYIKGNTISDYKDGLAKGIDAVYVDGLFIIGNEIKTNWEAIYLEDTDNVDIKDNRMEIQPTSGVTRSPQQIYVAKKNEIWSSAYNIRICDNYIKCYNTPSQKIGIRCVDTLDLAILDNYITNYAGAEDVNGNGIKLENIVEGKIEGNYLYAGNSFTEGINLDGVTSGNISIGKNTGRNNARMLSDSNKSQVAYEWRGRVLWSAKSRDDVYANSALWHGAAVSWQILVDLPVYIPKDVRQLQIRIQGFTTNVSKAAQFRASQGTNQTAIFSTTSTTSVWSSYLFLDLDADGGWLTINIEGYNGSGSDGICLTGILLMAQE